ncbi:hypothetical protein EVAR_88848_1 [Eumeta japonica]|uniref:Uncharacterized protein n=1 Tax=Eumeta variegata TaxID=151549 RepID=A0A4C1Y5Q3_EUMVA|nr:hypothetical protein EVAR_88848_1 [Eumeta japonica]
MSRTALMLSSVGPIEEHPLWDRQSRDFSFPLPRRRGSRVRSARIRQALLAAGGPIIIQQIRSAADAAAAASRPSCARTRKRNFLPQCFPAGGDGLLPPPGHPPRPRRRASSSRAYVPVPDALFHALTP